MTITRPTILAGVSLAALLALAACNNNEAPAPEAAPADAMAPAAAEPMVGGASMSPSDTIVTNAAKASNLTTLDLTKILTYHVVPGRLTAADIAAQATASGGTATLTTVQGESLKVSAGPNGSWVITDAKGGTSTITQADVAQSNGMVHVIDTVLMP